MLIFDLETDKIVDGITTLIHCLAIYDTESDIVHLFDPANKPIEQGIKMLMEADEICGHNIISFDIPAIQRVYPWFKPKGKVRDTLVQTRFVYADIKAGDYGRFRQGKLPGGLIGSHALKAWGYRLGEYKGDFGETTDWEVWTPEMSTYCVQDVKVTFKLWERIEYRGYPEVADWIEHRVATIIVEQESRMYPLVRTEMKHEEHTGGDKAKAVDFCIRQLLYLTYQSDFEEAEDGL